jgi:dolichyl-phosphate beta-glucosyltransferase
MPTEQTRSCIDSIKLPEPRPEAPTRPAASPCGPEPRRGDGGAPPEPQALALRSPVDLEVVIPAYNESARLPTTLRRSVEFLAEQPWRTRLVVVDNGSVDETAAVARAAVRPSGSVTVSVIGCSRAGKGAAVYRGLTTSTSPIVGFFDADLATPVETLTETVAALHAGAAAVIASRHVPGARFVSPQPLGRRLGGAAFRALTRPLVPGVHDTQCGFKFFQRNAVQAAMARCRMTGFAFDVELLAQIQRDGGSIVELPVSWTDRTGSTFHPIRDGFTSFGALLSLRGSI